MNSPQRQPQRSSNVVPLHSLRSLIETHIPTPASIAAYELCLFALMIQWPECARVICETLSDDDFVNHKTAGILRGLADNSELDELTARHALRSAGGAHMVDRILEAGSIGNVNFIDKYMHDVALEAQRRSAVKVTQDALWRLSQPEADSLALIENLRSGVDAVAAKGKNQRRHATMEDLDGQIQEEIAGTRADWGFPWEQLSTTLAMMPGSMTTICGNPGHGKSWLMFDMLRRWHLMGLPVVVMSLEKDKTFHLRRVAAQITRKGQLTSPEWTVAHADEWNELREANRPAIEAVVKAEIFQVFNLGEHPSVAFLLQWMKKEISRGRKILVIDPVTNMACNDSRFADEEKLIAGAGKLAAQYQVCIIFVTHPKTGPKMQVPDMYNMSGSGGFHRFVDSVFWLKSHKHEQEDYIVTGFGGVHKYTHEIFLLKTRNSGSKGQRIAYRFNHGSLDYTEIGVIREDCEE